MSKILLDKAVEEEKFQQFLILMEDILDDFVEEAEKFGFLMDFSEESLDLLEQYYLKRELELYEKQKGSFIEASACYLGDTLISVHP